MNFFYECLYIPVDGDGSTSGGDRDIYVENGNGHNGVAGGDVIAVLGAALCANLHRVIGPRGRIKLILALVVTCRRSVNETFGSEVA